jgi:hypothetical protein
VSGRGSAKYCWDVIVLLLVLILVLILDPFSNGLHIFYFSGTVLSSAILLGFADSTKMAGK